MSKKSGESNIGAIVKSFMETYYDPLKEARRIKENLNVLEYPGEPKITVTSLNPVLFPTIKLLIGGEGFISSAKTPADKVYNLTQEENSATIVFGRGLRYVTALADNIYVPVYHLEKV